MRPLNILMCYPRSFTSRIFRKMEGRHYTENSMLLCFWYLNFWCTNFWIFRIWTFVMWYFAYQIRYCNISLIISLCFFHNSTDRISKDFFLVFFAENIKCAEYALHYFLYDFSYPTQIKNRKTKNLSSQYWFYPYIYFHSILLPT